jgi:CelD/BcsL family acetyltransferase involved in cellulose biosynthesis
VRRETVTTHAALEALAPSWERLWRRACATPFQSAAWLLPWWKHIGCGELMCVAVRDCDDDELVGFAPLYIHTDESGVRHLFPLGIATTDRIDVLALPGREAEVARAIGAHVVTCADSWDVVEVPQLAAGALMLRCRWPAAWRCELRDAERNPVLTLPAPVPHALAGNIAYCRRRAARDHGFAFETADEGNVQLLLDELATLHARRWARHGEAGVLAAPGVLDWHRESAPCLLAQGVLRLIALRLGGCVAAVLYCLADAPGLRRRRWYDYIGGFDPRFAALSPGSLLIGHAIGQAFAEGATHFDFLRGAEPYKYRWGAVDQPMYALVLHK